MCCRNRERDLNKRWCLLTGKECLLPIMGLQADRKKTVQSSLGWGGSSENMES